MAYALGKSTHPGYTHVLQVFVSWLNRQGTLYWNHDTQTYKYDLYSKNIDASLTKEDRYADAKAVGKALSEKVGQVDFDNLSSIVAELNNGYEWHEIDLYGLRTVKISNIPESRGQIKDWDGLITVPNPNDPDGSKAIEFILETVIFALFTQGLLSKNAYATQWLKDFTDCYLAIREAGIFEDTVQFVYKKDHIIKQFILQYSSEKNVLTINQYNANGNIDQIRYSIVDKNIIYESIDIPFKYTKEYIDEAIAAIPPQVQSDWKQTDESAVDFIKNKPNEMDALELVSEMGLVDPVADSSNFVYVDENNVIYTLI